MKSKKKLLKESRLYLIIDKKMRAKNSLIDILTEIKGTGVDVVQLRDKESKKEDILREAFYLRKLLAHSKTLFMVNDYLDIAKIADSDGLHLGQSDTSLETARKVLGRDKIIGISCHNLKQAITAQERGADYISIGPLFATPTKPEYKPIGLSLIKGIRKKVKIPFFVIGNVNRNNINRILLSGAKRIAVCRAILKAGDIRSLAKYFSKTLH